MRSVLLHCLIYKVHSLEFLAHQRNLRISHLLPFVNPFFKVFLKLFSGPTRALHFSLRSLKRSVNITLEIPFVNTFFTNFYYIFCLIRPTTNSRGSSKYTIKILTIGIKIPEIKCIENAFFMTKKAINKEIIEEKIIFLFLFSLFATVSNIDPHIFKSKVT